MAFSSPPSFSYIFHVHVWHLHLAKAPSDPELLEPFDDNISPLEKLTKKGVKDYVSLKKNSPLFLMMFILFLKEY